MSNLEDFIFNCNSKVDDWKRRLKILKEKEEIIGGHLKDSYNIATEKIKSKLEAAGDEISEYELMAEEKWAEMKEQRLEDWQKIESFIEHALKKYL